MKRAVISPLLSLFMPGLGQVFNHQVGKGAFMVAGVSILFMATLGVFVYKFHHAAVALADLPAGADKWQALHLALLDQGVISLLVLLGLYLAVLIFAVLDAWRGGRAYDEKQIGKS